MCFGFMPTTALQGALNAHALEIDVVVAKELIFGDV